MEGEAKGRVGFIGIGNMGWPMAPNLARAGFQVVIYDTDPNRSARFAAEHATTAAGLLGTLGEDGHARP